MKILIIVWFIGFAITSPIVLALCKSTKLGDKGNKFVDKEIKN
jgi:hypothetical protein